jgi:hypothetical protein
MATPIPDSLERLSPSDLIGVVLDNHLILNQEQMRPTDSAK